MIEKNFVIKSIIIIIIIATITSFIGVKVFQDDVLLGPEQEGIIYIENIPSGANVIIIDNSVVTGISDTVDFGIVSSGSSYQTDKTGTGGANAPYPFLLRNEGNSDAHVDAKFTLVGKLFDYEDSKVYLWVEDADRQASLDVGWNEIDDCDDTINLGVPGCINPTIGDCLTNGQVGCELQSVSAGIDISVVDSLNWENCRDESYLHIGIELDNGEIGSHSATLEITGSVTSGLNPNYMSDACWVGY